MCGRYAITSPPEALRRLFGYVEQPNFPPRYNIAPTQPIPLVHAARSLAGSVERRFLLARWGFLPGFVKAPGEFPLLVNAKSETVVEKPSFRAAMKRRRCLLPADAYYEWLRGPSPRAPKRPFLFRRADGQPMGLAGLYETWSGADGSEVDTCCILTTSANGATCAIHDRMPAILEPRDFTAWLDVDGVSADAAQRLLRPAGQDVLEFFEIAPVMNKVGADGPALQTPLSAAGLGPPAAQSSNSLV